MQATILLEHLFRQSITNISRRRRQIANIFCIMKIFDLICFRIKTNFSSTRISDVAIHTLDTFLYTLVFVKCTHQTSLHNNNIKL